MRNDILIGVFLVVVLGWAVWEARDWPERTRFFPLAIGLPVLILAMIQLGLNVWKALRPQIEPDTVVPAEKGEAADEPGDAAADTMVDAKLLHQRTLEISAWAVAFALGLWLFGFKLGGFLLGSAFLRFQARESWHTSVLYGLGIYLFFFAGLEMALGFPLPPGLLASSLGLQSFDSYVADPILNIFND